MGKNAKRKSEVGSGDNDHGESDGGGNNGSSMPGKRVLTEDPTESTRGVVYISRVPPNFGPAQLRALLARHADVQRVFLQERNEDAADGAKRRQQAVSKQVTKRKSSFKHGWVEFTRKKDAKRVALLLNNTRMGGKRRAKFHDDLWNIKYLRGFSWDDLVDDMIQERKRKAQRIKYEIDQAAKECDFYISRIDQAKAIESMRDRRASRDAPRHGSSDLQQERSGRVFDHKPTDKAKPPATNQVDLSLLNKLFA